VRAEHDAYADVGAFQVRAGLDAKRVPEAMKVIVGELRKAGRLGVTASELKMAKEHLHGALALKLEDSSDRAEFYGRQELWNGKAHSPDVWLSRYERVTRAQIASVAKDVLDERCMSIAAVGPYKDAAALLRVAKLL
jgi:predicted Zn-dependent peptidase